MKKEKEALWDKGKKPDGNSEKKKKMTRKKWLRDIAYETRIVHQCTFTNQELEAKIDSVPLRPAPGLEIQP